MLQLKLAALLDRHLVKNTIWGAPFFNVLEDKKQDPRKVWEMLIIWAENMMAASYGFQGYVLHLAARAPVERVRRLLLENAFEELGDIEYPLRSHFQMICNLCRLCGIPDEFIGKPRLLPTSINHVETHLWRCRGEQGTSFLHGLGMIFLIENLTRLEFERVLIGFIDWWEMGSGRPLSEFAVGNGVAYFTANMEADDGHAEDVARMIDTTLREINHVDTCDGSGSAFEPLLMDIAAGMEESITLRAAFLQGCYESVFGHGEGSAGIVHQAAGDLSYAT